MQFPLPDYTSQIKEILQDFDLLVQLRVHCANRNNKNDTEMATPCRVHHRTE